MSSISINCTVSLSKKLRALLDKSSSCSVVLTADTRDGKGFGKLSLDSDMFSNIPENILEIGETSIQITPAEITDETPNSESASHAAIFSTIPEKGEVSPVVNKIAAVNAPDRGEEAHAIVSKEDVEIPKAFEELKDVDCQKWIANMEDLVQAVNVAKGKKSDIDPDIAQTDRERAVLMELKSKDESIDLPAWIVNENHGSITVNDLDITLLQNTPYDLSNISARRILISRDLRSLLKGGYVKFLSPSEKDDYVLKENDEQLSHGYEVFDNQKEAAASITNSVSANPVIDDDSAMEITDEDVDAPSERESMILNLTQNSPTTKTTIASPQGSRHTVHGKQSRPSSNHPISDSKSPSIKPIRKLS